MAKQVTLVAGDVSDETLAWFKAHGATVEGFGLVTITLPEEALVHHGNRGWDYSISFYNHEGNDEQSWVDIELALDVYETSVEVKYDGDRECSCKGRGCAECVEELATIAAGGNPYAHHTPVASERPEDSTEHVNDLSGHNQEVAWERAQEAAAPSDAEIEAIADLAAWPGYNHAFFADGTDLDGAVLGD